MTYLKIYGITIIFPHNCVSLYHVSVCVLQSVRIPNTYNTSQKKKVITLFRILINQEQISHSTSIHLYLILYEIMNRFNNICIS